MNIRDYFLRKRTGSIHEQSEQPLSSSCDPVDEAAAKCEPLISSEESEPLREKKHVSVTTSKKKLYKAKVSYKRNGRSTTPGFVAQTLMMACFVILARSTVRGAWITRGMKDWNHATELLKQQMHSQWHRDAAITAAITEQAESGSSVLEL